MTDQKIGYEECRQGALAQLEAGDTDGALRSFRPALNFPGQLDSDARWKDALEVFEKISTMIVGPDFAKFIRAARQDINNIDNLYDLGYQLIEFGLPEVAATVLHRANRLRPGEEGILCELVTALECSGIHKTACDLIREQPRLLKESFMVKYLLAYNSLAMGDLEEPRRILPDLQKSDSSQHKYMANAIAGMVSRADTIKSNATLDERDLRGWHYVLNGSILTHISPYGFESMNGRYAFVQDNNGLLKEGILRIQSVLKALKFEVPCVYTLPDRPSEILGLACARILGVETKPWGEAGRKPGLVVAYDIGNLEDELLKLLWECLPGQLLWSHAVSWTQPPPYAPEVVTFLHQVNVNPWGGVLRLDDSGKAVKTESDTRDSETLAKEICDAPLEPEALQDLETLSDFVSTVQRSQKEHGVAPSSGNRKPLRRESPVTSSRFI